MSKQISKRDSKANTPSKGTPKKASQKKVEVEEASVSTVDSTDSSIDEKPTAADLAKAKKIVDSMSDDSDSESDSDDSKVETVSDEKNDAHATVVDSKHVVNESSSEEESEEDDESDEESDDESESEEEIKVEKKAESKKPENKKFLATGGKKIVSESSSEDDEDETSSVEEKPVKGGKNAQSKRKKTDVSTEEEPLGKKQKKSEYAVFIKGFGEMSENDLRRELEKYGQVDDIRLPKDTRTGKVKGFAYVDMADESGYKKVMKLKKINGVEVFVDEPRSSVPKDGIKTIFVRNIPYSSNATKLQSYFNKFGTITACRVPKDEKTGDRNKGFAFVETNDLKVFNNILKAKHVFEDKELRVTEADSDRNRTNNNNERGNFRNNNDRGNFGGNMSDRFNRNDRGGNKFKNGREDSKSENKNNKNKKIVFDDDSSE